MPTKAQKSRLNLIKTEIPCLCCLLTWEHSHINPPWEYTWLPDLHHPTSAGRRLGAHIVYPACGYHHRGLIDPVAASGAVSAAQTLSGALGPSLAWGSKPFHRFFGSDEILLELTDHLVKSFESQPFPSYSPPYELRKRSLEWWKRRKRREN